MTIAIHQPNYIPYPGYFAKMMQADVWVWLDNVQYTFGSAKAVTNRNKIKSNNGELMLTIPVIKSSGPIIKDIEIDYKQNWVEKHLKTIEQFYKKSPNYSDVIAIIESELNKNHQYLSDLNIALNEKIAAHLKINIEFKKASEITTDHTLQRDDLLIHLVQICHGDKYLSGKGGLKYMELDKYEVAKIEVEFMKYTPKEYNQNYPPFIENLSIVDFMFCCDYQFNHTNIS
jgi:hypothetical protein